MSEAKHTPGPWHLERQQPGAFGTAIGEPIAVVGGEATGENVEFIVGRTCDCGPHGDAQTEANARLIAAAPELLQAVRGFLHLLPADGGISLRNPKYPAYQNLVAFARETLAKAEGA